MDNLQPIIDRISDWQNAKEIKLERLAGLTNVNYLVTVDQERYVLRVSGQNTARLGIDRSHELAALQAASKAGICPAVVAYLPPEGHLVTRWVEGYHWTAEEFRTLDNVRLLTETVKHIHTLPPNGAIFSPFQRVETFLKTAQTLQVPLPVNLDPCLQTMRSIRADQEKDPANWQRLCHNDLVSVNYLYNKTQQRIQVLDWEFAGWGDLYYDLATIVYTHDSDGPISTELEEEMLACYFGEITPWQKRRLLGMKMMLMLFTGAWGLAQHGMVLAGIIPPAVDFDYLEFAQWLFDEDIDQLRKQYDLAGANR